MQLPLLFVPLVPKNSIKCTPIGILIIIKMHKWKKNKSEAHTLNFAADGPPGITGVDGVTAKNNSKKSK